MTADTRRIVVARHAAGGKERRGEVVRVLGEPGSPRYLVRWEDGRESIVYPGTEGLVRPKRARSSQPAAARPAPQAASRTEPKTRASVGDRLVIRAHRLGEPSRDAEILDVLGEDGGPPYRVRWEDNSHESILFPGPDAFVERFSHGPKRRRGRGS